MLGQLKKLEYFCISADFSKISEDEFGIFCEKLVSLKKLNLDIEPLMYRGKNIIKLQKLLKDRKRVLIK